VTSSVLTGSVVQYQREPFMVEITNAIEVKLLYMNTFIYIYMHMHIRMHLSGNNKISIKIHR
jgi:hypothetical protein